MRVLLTSHGSTGDIYPVIRLGKALVDAGHRVRFATVRLFREEIEGAGIEFVALPPDWDQSGFAEAMRDLTHARNPLELLSTIYRESLPFIDEILSTLRVEMRSADIFVSSYIFAHMTTLARERGIPSVVLTFAHNVVPSAGYPPENVPRLFAPAFLRRCWNRNLWRLADRIICWQINRVLSETLARHQLPPARSFLLDPADRVLVTVSKPLFEPRLLWNERFRFTGYLRWQSPGDAAVEAELRAFCAGERVPVLTFGSVTFDEARKVMTRFMRNWPEGKKIIIQAGWAGLTIERPRSETMRVGRLSHDVLFKYASMVIHHGGAGTTASVLHAGVPQIIVPHIADQWFFAGEMERLGVGIEVKRARWPELLPGAVKRIERDPKMSRRALEIAEILALEDGPGNAVRELESMVGAATASDIQN